MKASKLPSGAEQPSTQTNKSRQTGDLTVYKYYCQATGWHNAAFGLSMAVANAFCVVFPSESIPNHKPTKTILITA